MADPVRVLIADDHPIVRQGLATVLGMEEDVEVVGQASNGIEAVSQARALHPHVVLMDLKMPEMDGVEATQQLKEEAPEIAVIVLTTYDSDDYIFRGLEAGARSYLLKDATPDTFVEAIRAARRGESIIEPKVASRLLERLSQLSRAATSEELLSPREVEVLQLMATGAANKEIASQLFIGESTVKTHIIHIFNKLGVKDRTGAVATAASKGIIRL